MKKVKRYSLWSLVAFLLCLCFPQAKSCDISIEVIQTGNIYLQNGTSQCTLRIFNNSSSLSPAFNITVFTGNSFIGNAIVSPGSVNIINPGFPDPFLALDPGAIGANNHIDIVLSFGINPAESCNLIANFSAQLHFINSFDVSIPGCGSQTDVNAQGFTVYFPKISVIYADEPIDVYVGQIIYRKVVLHNLGNYQYDATTNGPIIIHNDHVPQFEILDIAKEIGFNTYSDLSVPITNPLSNSEYSIDQATFNFLMGGSNILPVHAQQPVELVYYEKLQVLQCISSYSSNITPYWDINGQLCPTDQLYHTSLTSQQSVPKLSVDPSYINPPRNYCYDSNNENDIRLALTNTQSGVANNITVHLQKNSNPDPDYTEIEAGSFIITQTVAGNTTTLTSPADYTITTPPNPSSTAFCDGQFYFQDFVIDFADNIGISSNTGDNIYIEYKIKTCCPPSVSGCYSQSQHYDAWQEEAYYGGFCDGLLRHEDLELVSVNDYALGGTGGFSYDGPIDINVPYGGSPTFSEPYPVTFSFTGNPLLWPYNQTNYQFYLDISLTPDLVFCGDATTDFTLTSTALGTINPTSLVYLSGVNLPGADKVVRLSFTLTNNILNSLTNSDLTFCIKGHCPDNPGPEGMTLAYYYLPDISCIPGCPLQFACKEQDVMIHCPGCLRQGIHSESYRISRTTFGYVDATNNGRWDGVTPTSITTATVGSYPGVKKKRVMVGDEFEGLLKTHVELNGYQPFNWSYNGSIPPQLDFYNGYWHCSFSHGNNITPVNAWVQIIENETTSVCTSPPCTTILNLPPPQIFTTINTNCYIGLSGTDFYYDFSISALQAANPGVPGIPTRFSQSMQLEFHNKFRQTGNVGADFETNEAQNLIYLTVRPETSPNVDGVPGGCPLDPDDDVADYVAAHPSTLPGHYYDDFCNYAGAPYPCEDIQWFCTKQGDNYTQVGFNTQEWVGNFSFDNTSCVYKFNVTGYFDVGTRLGPSARTNAFPFEYRNWNYVDHVDFTYPAGFTPLGITRTIPYTFSGYPIRPLNQIQANEMTSLSVTNMTPTSCTVNLSGITDDGSEGGYPLQIYLGPADDDYYNDGFSFSFLSDCNILDGGTSSIGDITWIEYQHYASQLVGSANEDGTFPITAQTDPFIQHTAQIIHNSPDLTIQNQTLNPSAYNYNAHVEWNVLVTNTTPFVSPEHSAAPNVWMAVTPTVNTSGSIYIHRIEVQDILNSSVYYDLVDVNGVAPGVGNYQMGTLYFLPATITTPNMIPLSSAGGFYKFRVTASHIDCANGDELQVNSGWLCQRTYNGQVINTITDYQNRPCGNEIVTDLLNVAPTPAILQVCVNDDGCNPGYVPVIAQPCSTVTYQIKIQSNDIGFLDDINFNMDLLPGSGLNFSGNAIITYQNIILGNIAPVGNNLNFNFSNIVFNGTVIQANGLPGDGNVNYPNTEDHYILVTVTLQTGCEFSYNLDGGFELTVGASCCQQPVIGYHNYYNPVLESPSFSYDDMDVEINSIVDPVCSNVFTSSITVTNNSSTPSNAVNNVLYLDVPAGMFASNFSVLPLNPFGPSPYNWAPGILAGLSNGSSVTITFTVTASDIACGNYPVASSVYTDDDIVCQLQPCAVVHQLQDEDISNINILPPSSTFTLPGTDPCINDLVTIMPDIICPGVLYTWDINGTQYTGTTVTHSFPSAGGFPISLTASYGPSGCSSVTDDDINVEPCDPCAGLAITTDILNCEVIFTALTPNMTGCDHIEYYWDYGDGSNSGGNLLTNPVSHLYTQSGSFFVWFIAYCMDGKGNVIYQCKSLGEYVIVDCKACEDLKISANSENCDYTFTANTPNMTGCDHIEYYWDYGDGSNSGTNVLTNQTTHHYSQNGTYMVWFIAYCMDKNGNILYQCKSQSLSVEVRCEECEGLYFTTTLNECEVTYTAFAPSMSGCANVMYYWDFGDGTNSGPYSLSNQAIHPYGQSGSYFVWFVAFCYDNSWNLIYQCKSEGEYVEVECDQTFCTEINNSATGSFSGEDAGRSIVATPDGGYIIVGTVNERLNSSASVTDESDIYVVKYDANNTIQFQRRIGETVGGYLNERGFSILVRSDAYYVSGVAYKNYGLDHDLVITKILLNGTVSWAKRFGYGNAKREEPARLVDMTYNGTDNILVVGNANNGGTASSPSNISTSNFDFMAFAITTNGTITGPVKKYRFDSGTGVASEYAYDAIRVNGANAPEYFIAGEYAPCITGCPDRDGLIIKIDQNLNILGSQKLALSGRIESLASLEYDNGSLYVAGYNQLTGNNERIWITSLDTLNLNVQTSTLYNNPASTNSRAHAIKKANVGKLAVVGRAISSGTDYDGVCLQINPGVMNVIWSGYTNDPLNNHYFNSISENYILTGVVKRAAPLNNELVITQVDPINGSSCCLEPVTYTDGTVTYTNASSCFSSLITLNTFPLLSDTPSYPEVLICPEEARISQATTNVNSEMLVYPNPNAGSFTIRITGAAQKISELKLYDLTGRVLFVKQVDESHGDASMEISLPGVAKGVYFVEVKTATNKFVSKILIQ